MSHRKSVVFSSSCLAMCCSTSVRTRSKLPTACHVEHCGPCSTGCAGQLHWPNYHIDAVQDMQRSMVDMLHGVCLPALGGA